MNIINACAKYTGYEESIKALRFEIPGKGKNPTPTPIFIIHSFAAKETSANPNAFDKGENVLITGRLYKRKPEVGEEEDGRMYVVPTQELQIAHPECELNHVQLAGQVCWRGELKPLPQANAVFNCFIYCKGGKEKKLNRDWGDDVNFKIETWGDEAKRWDDKLHVGLALALGGTLKFNCWTAKDGSKQGDYKVGVKNLQHAFFGSKQNIVAGEDIKKGEEVTIENNKEKKCKEVFMKNKKTTPQAIATPAVEVTKDADDGIPF